MKHTLARLMAIGLGLLATCSAQAHKPSDAYIRIEPRGDHYELRLDVALRDLDRELELDADGDGRLTWGELRERWTDVTRLVESAVTLEPHERCHTMARAAPALEEHSDGLYAVLTRTLACDEGVAPVLEYRLFARSDPTHRGIALWSDAQGREHTAVLGPDAPRWSTPVDDAHEKRSGGFTDFVREGVHHILIGYDHLLFLLALLLPSVVRPARGGGWEAARAWRPVAREVLAVVTAFTVAHSITLALSALRLVEPPSRWVESAIAASVVAAAVMNLLPRAPSGRAVLAFAFGLVHGFGFASVLHELGLSAPSFVQLLFGFNLGVEIGQLAVVTLFLPLAWLARATPWYGRVAMNGGSLAIALVAGLWFVERAFEVSLSLP